MGGRVTRNRARAKKKGPFEVTNGPSLGRKRPRRASGTDIRRYRNAQYVIAAHKFQGVQLSQRANFAIQMVPATAKPSAGMRPERGQNLLLQRSMFAYNHLNTQRKPAPQ